MNKRYVLSVSYGNYKTSIGGTDKVILAHSEMFNKAGIGYVFLFPLNLFHNHPIPKNPFWGIIDDGVFVGTFHTEGVLDYLRDLSDKYERELSCVHIHHLKKVNTDNLSKILKSVNCDVYFYIHDYYNMCVSINLLRSDTGRLCHGKLEEEKCKGCEYYKDSLIQKKNFLSVVKSVSKDYYLVFPSDAAKDRFLTGYPEFSDKAMVIYHQTLLDEYYGNREPHRPLRVAYIGSQLSHKGWDDFLKIVNLNQSSEAYKFYYFGKKAVENPDIKHISVDFKDSLNAMTDALRDNEIDCVILWSIWEETYSYTFYEAYSANCYIVSCNESGNIQYQIKKRGCGRVLRDKEELLSFFSNPSDVQVCVTEYKKNSKAIPLNTTENDYIVSLTPNVAEKTVITDNIKPESFIQKASDKLINRLFRWRSGVV